MVGRVLRHDSLIRTIIEGSIEGRKSRVRPRLLYMMEVKQERPQELQRGGEVGSRWKQTEDRNHQFRLYDDDRLTVTNHVT